MSRFIGLSSRATRIYIEEYFQEQKELHKNGFNLLTNNCEQFANGFYGKKVMRQTEFYLTMAAVAAVTWAAMKGV